MKIKKKLSNTLLLIIITFLGQSTYIYGQEATQSTEEFIQKGRITSSFNMSGITASRDDFNQEFERSYDKATSSVDALYFISNRVGVGAFLGLDFIKQNFEDPNRLLPPSSSRIRDLKIGIQSSYYLPASSLFKSSNALSESYFFAGGNITRYLDETRFGSSTSNFKDYKWSYGLNGGILFPIGKRIGLEAKVQWFASPEEYVGGFIDNQGNPVITSRESKLDTELNIGLGFKFRF